VVDLSLWHYPRPALAESYLAALKSGIAVSTTIFAPRRMGKTTFLRKDLTPMAEKQGFTVVYADLWQTKQAPALALINALEQALEPKTVGAKINARLNTPLKGLKAGAEFAGAKLSAEVSLEPLAGGLQKEQAERALRINSLIKALCEKKPVLLLVDEAQEFAKSRENELVATALRTAITLNQEKLRVVFTGSSRTQLASVFSDSKAPLYSSGVAITDFPLLDENFVIFILEKFKEASGNRELDPHEAWHAFLALNHQPEPFLKCVFHLLITPSLAFSDALKQVQDELLRSENHEGTWARLDASQKTLVRLLATNPSLKPFSADVIAELRQKIGIDAIQKSHVQRAITKLTDAGIVLKTADGLYEFENPSFKEWLRTVME
jgi:hypothetical protein